MALVLSIYIKTTKKLAYIGDKWVKNPLKLGKNAYEI